MREIKVKTENELKRNLLTDNRVADFFIGTASAVWTFFLKAGRKTASVFRSGLDWYAKHEWDVMHVWTTNFCLFAALVSAWDRRPVCSAIFVAMYAMWAYPLRRNHFDELDLEDDDAEEESVPVAESDGTNGKIADIGSFRRVS